MTRYMSKVYLIERFEKFLKKREKCRFLFKDKNYGVFFSRLEVVINFKLETIRQGCVFLISIWLLSSFLKAQILYPSPISPLFVD